MMSNFSDSNSASETTWSESSYDTSADGDDHLVQIAKRARTRTRSFDGTAVLKPDTSAKVVLVTGCAGFIGSHTALALMSRGDVVVGLDEVNDYYDVNVKRGNLDLLHENSSFTFYQGDVADTALLKRIFKANSITHVCHLAARAGVRPSIEDPHVYVHSNVTATTTLLQQSVESHVKNFVYASSSSVYGGSKATYFSERDDVSFPVSPYAATKKACELMAHTFSHIHGLPTSGLRFFTVFGERGRPDMAPLMFIDRISRGLQIKQFGDGTSSRDYTYVSDIVDGILRSIDRPYACEVFNLGKGSGTTLLEFIGMVEKYTNKKAVKDILPDQLGDVPRTCADTSKARVLLGYNAKVMFAEGIRRTVAWYNRKNGIKNCAAMLKDSPLKIDEHEAKIPQIIRLSSLGRE